MVRLSLPSRLSGPLLGAICVIAAGVGLSGMVFALADPALRSLPYVDPDRLVAISFGLPPPGGPANPADVPSLANWQERTDLFVGVAAFLDRGWLRVRLSDRMLALRAVAVTDNLLEVLGVESRFVESDPAAAWVSSHVTALSGGELQLGRAAPIEPEGVLRVRGILPGSFLLPEVNRTEPVDALINLPVGAVIRIQGSGSQALDLVARLRPGVTPQLAEAALNVSMARLGRRVAVVPLSIVLNARLRGLATGALVASCLVVLVCWTNVFSMAVTRGLYRTGEIATRTALGASPTRILALLAGEALKAAGLGTAGALAVTWLALAAALPALPAQFATLGAPSVTMRVVLFVVLAGVIAGGAWCVASVLAWKLGVKRRGLNFVSRDGGTIRIVRFVLIAGQLGAASVLLVGSMLLGRSYLNLMSVDSGLDDRTQTLTVAHDPNIPLALRPEVVERTLMAFRKASGVVAVGASAGSLLDGRGTTGGVEIDGHWRVSPPPDLTFVAGDYFKAMGLQFLAGGPPEPGNADVAVVTESAAREFFGGQPPIGAVIFRDRDLRIVGVVKDVRSWRLSVPARPGVYVQAGGWHDTQTTYVLRVADSSVPTASWERIVHGADPLAVVLDVSSVRERLDRSVRDRTFATLVIGLFALSSLFVAALGLAGVVAYTVKKRTREIAIRLALGATPDAVTKLVVRDAVSAATCGVVGGVIASAWLSRALESLLFGVPPADPTTLGLTAVGLLGAVLAAATLPGIRAGRIAPAIALRVE